MVDPYKSSFLAWQQEKKIFEAEKLKNPELFARAPVIDDTDTLINIGIHATIFGTRILGHIKLNTEDFIVEEVTRDGTLHTIDDGPLYASSEEKPLPEQKTIWCDAIKMGIDTIEVIEEISRALGIEKKSIGFAGIKDKHAITAQSLSFRNTPAEKLATIQAPLFL